MLVVMCGRYASSRSKVQLSETFHVSADHADEVTRQDYNIAPSKRAPIVLSALAPNAAEDAQAVRQLRLARWGITPAWMAKSGTKGKPLSNARAETIAEKKTFQRPFERRRCIVAADGFYEWFATDDSTKAKQPFFFRPKDGLVLAMAGIVEWWHEPDDKTLWIPTFSIITTTATDDAGKVHDRMPMTIPADRWDGWLDPDLTDTATALKLMTPPAKGSLDIYPVDRAVGNVRNNSAALTQPIAPPA
jgi:putative SOS response-associated peptidase YedK